MIQTVYVKNIQELAVEVRKPEPAFFTGAKTSTVIPYTKEEALTELGATRIIDLSRLEKKIEKITHNGEVYLRVSGAVTWADLREYCKSNNFLMLTSPTEENALVLSGLATSATGERCFGFGTLRDQVYALRYLDGNGELHDLHSESPMSELLSDVDESILAGYQEQFNKSFEGFKNGPYPRLQNETDLLIGTEGQLGVIVEADLMIKPRFSRSFIFIELARWEEDDQVHIELMNWAQDKRSKIVSFELIDSNSLKVLPKDEMPISSIESDLLFLEVDEQNVESLFGEITQSVRGVEAEKVFLMDETRCHQLRMAIPRYTFERNSQMGVLKKGTDVQVSPENFKELLALYREFSKKGIDYNLFGHFGDCHLHFNFFPNPDQQDFCDSLFDEFYKEIKNINGSPFAEHGIGLFKQKFIKQFYGETQINMFKSLKKKYDPENKFFPGGFMSIRL